MDKFEYNYCTFSHGMGIDSAIKKLNELGNEGWEVVTSVNNSGTNGGVIFFLKRKIHVEKRKKNG